MTSAPMERPIQDELTGLARRARLASRNGETLAIAPEVAEVLADYLHRSLSEADEQAWFWSEGWQAGEREAEADLAAGRHGTFDSMEDLLADLGWPA